MDFMKTPIESLTIPQHFPISLETSPLPPKSPLIFFLNLCHVLLFVPFHIKWNYTKNQFMLFSNTVQSVACALVHTLVLSYIIFTLADHFLNFTKLSGSYVSACFDIINTTASALLWICFMKLIWFGRNKMQDIINLTNSNNITSFYINGIKFVVISIGLIYVYFNFEAASHISKRSIETEDLPLYYDLYKFFNCCWPPGSWILMCTQAHVLLFYFVNHGFTFVLSCTMLFKAWEFKKEIYFNGTDHIYQAN